MSLISDVLALKSYLLKTQLLTSCTLRYYTQYTGDCYSYVTFEFYSVSMTPVGGIGTRPKIHLKPLKTSVKLVLTLQTGIEVKKRSYFIPEF